MLKKILIGLLGLALLVAVPTPARAASYRFNILASAAQTATAQSGGVSVAGVTEMVVAVQCTVVSGTNPQLTVYLQTSRDGGSTWFDALHEGAVILTSGAGTVTTEPNQTRNIVQGVGATFSATARYRVFGDYVRLAWVISGSATPTFTFQADAVAK